MVLLLRPIDLKTIMAPASMIKYMLGLFAVGVLVTGLSKEQTFGFDFCNFTHCDKVTKVKITHALCRVQDMNISNTCNPDHLIDESAYLEETDKKNILRIINRLRRLVARGMVPNMPPAFDVHPLEWDPNLSLLAKILLIKCDELNHDNLKNDSAFLSSACKQTSLNMGYSNYYEGFLNDYEFIIENWFERYKEMPPQIVNTYKEPNKTDTQSPAKSNASLDLVQPPEEPEMYHLYTQLVWAATTRVGCDRILYHNYDKRFPPRAEQLLCIFEPMGNEEGQPVYTAGPMEAWKVDTEDDNEIPNKSTGIGQRGLLVGQILAISFGRLISLRQAVSA